MDADTLLGRQQSLLRVTNLALTAAPPLALTAPYTNWRGVTANRHVKPTDVWWGISEFHPDTDLFLTGVDLARDVERHFRIEDFDLVGMKLELMGTEG